jgi:hypothetical protein
MKYFPNFSSIFLILILIANPANADEQVENSFNTNIHQNAGDFLTTMPGIFACSDTWFTRGLIFRQSPYNSLGVKYNNVPLNSVLDGSFRGDFISFYDVSIYQINTESDISSNAESLAGSVNLKSGLGDTTHLKAIIEGGNVFGSTIFDYSGKHNYLRWNTGVSYITSGGFDVSQSRPDTVSFARTNSGFEKISANGRMSITDNKSFLDAEFLYSQSNQSFPFNLNPENQIFLKEPDFRLNLFNIMFRTYLNNGLELNGNVFYVRTKSILEKYDDATRQNRLLPTSFAKSFEERRFGWNTALKFDTDNIPPGEITLNYSRESLKYQSNSGFPVKNYEIERLNLGLKFADKMEYWDYSIGGNYRLINPLTALENEILNSYNDIEYFFNVGINFTDYFKFFGSLSRRVMLPQMYLIYPEINHSEMSFGMPVSTANTIAEVGLKYHILNKLKIDLKYFNMHYNNIQVPFYLVENPIELLPNSLNSQGLEFAVFADIYFADIILNAQYIFDNSSIYDSFNREIIIPEYQIRTTLTKQYQFGFSWLIESSFVGGRESNLTTDSSPEDFLFLNVRLSQSIYNQNEVYFRVNNLTDSYYEYYIGMPMPGIYFVAGVRLIL